MEAASRLDIRGWQEMHPLDGPAWSLFFEYAGNLLYALVVRRFPVWALGLLTALSAGLMFRHALTAGDMVGGWSLDPPQFYIGAVRLMFPFFGGLLLYRTVRPGKFGAALPVAALLLVLALALPRMGAGGPLWQNGLYDALAILIAFPFIVVVGASGAALSPAAERLCRWLGGISYPIYITHYAFIYIYTGWVATHKLKMADAWPFAMLTFAASVAVAQACLKLYDEPVRAWLKRKVG